MYRPGASVHLSYILMHQNIGQALSHRCVVVVIKLVYTQDGAKAAGLRYTIHCVPELSPLC
ncbi:hypothetical protein SAMN02927921_01460 [Sinomicrobium oceani]|uniref:Uncharacterized protein n=1 Tax=Sinomicrobium oceani TaxID=1150368 RepID=A0A1K1NTU4_9FLAO|nr:hypothetical protein SAMN02927921_01460 [Sinomicrobium oceani]